jgi:hypothetical protein
MGHRVWWAHSLGYVYPLRPIGKAEVRGRPEEGLSRGKDKGHYYEDELTLTRSPKDPTVVRDP